MSVDTQGEITDASKIIKFNKNKVPVEEILNIKG